MGCLVSLPFLRLIILLDRFCLSPELEVKFWQYAQYLDPSKEGPSLFIEPECVKSQACRLTFCPSSIPSSNIRTEYDVDKRLWGTVGLSRVCTSRSLVISFSSHYCLGGCRHLKKTLSMHFLLGCDPFHQIFMNNGATILDKQWSSSLRRRACLLRLSALTFTHTCSRGMARIHYTLCFYISITYYTKNAIQERVISGRTEVRDETINRLKETIAQEQIKLE
jgi:hypothetical protein